MKFFKTADGRFINPHLVTHCYVTKRGGVNRAQFFFKENSINICFESKSYAESEVKDFLNHCEEI